MYVLMFLVKALYEERNKQKTEYKKTDLARQNSAFCIVVTHMIIMLKF